MKGRRFALHWLIIDHSRNGPRIANRGPMRDERREGGIEGCGTGRRWARLRKCPRIITNYDYLSHRAFRFEPHRHLNGVDGKLGRVHRETQPPAEKRARGEKQLAKLCTLQHGVPDFGHGFQYCGLCFKECSLEKNSQSC